MSVYRGAFEERILLTGQMVAEEGVELTTPNTNQWPVPIRWIVEDGTYVEEGDPVVQFDNSQVVSNLDALRDQVQEAHNQLATKRSQVANDVAQTYFARENRRADLEKAEIEASVPAHLKAKQDVERSRLELEKARLELETAEHHYNATQEAGRRDIEVQELEVQKAERRIQRAERSLDLLDLRAPQSGVVLVSSHPMDGNTYRSGDNAIPGTTVASFPDLDSLMVEAQLFDVDDGKIQVGDTVLATLDTFPDWHIGGKVRTISPFADRLQESSTRRVFRVRVDLDEVDKERMRPGMSVKVEVARRSEGELLIPRQALDLQEFQVFATTDDGKRHPVSIDRCNSQVCILTDGPAEGTRLRPAEPLTLEESSAASSSTAEETAP